MDRQRIERALRLAVFRGYLLGIGWKWAAERIVELNDVECIPMLIHMFDKLNDKKAHVATKIIGQLGGPDVTGFLRQQAEHHPYWEVKETAIEGLVKIGGSRSTPLLVELLLTRHQWIMVRVARHLQTFGWLPTSTEEQVLYAWATRNYRVITTLSGNVTPIVCELLTNSPVLRKEALGILGERKDPAAVPAIRAVILDDVHHQVTDAATSALAQIGTQDAIDILVQVFDADEGIHHQHTLKALRQLGWTPQTLHQRLMAAILDKNIDDIVALGMPVCGELLRYVRSPETVWAHFWAVRALARINPEMARAVFEPEYAARRNRYGIYQGEYLAGLVAIGGDVAIAAIGNHATSNGWSEWGIEQAERILNEGQVLSSQSLEILSRLPDYSVSVMGQYSDYWGGYEYESYTVSAEAIRQKALARLGM